MTFFNSSSPFHHTIFYTRKNPVSFFFISAHLVDRMYLSDCTQSDKLSYHAKAFIVKSMSCLGINRHNIKAYYYELYMKSIHHPRHVCQIAGKCYPQQIWYLNVCGELIDLMIRCDHEYYKHP